MTAKVGCLRTAGKESVPYIGCSPPVLLDRLLESFVAVWSHGCQLEGHRAPTIVSQHAMKETILKRFRALHLANIKRAYIFFIKPTPIRIKETPPINMWSGFTQDASANKISKKKKQISF